MEIGSRDYYKELVEYSKSPEHKVILDILDKIADEKKRNIITTVLNGDPNKEETIKQLTEDKYFIKLINRVRNDINLARNKNTGKEG